MGNRFTLLGSSLENNNRGVGALTVGTITSILAQHPDAEIVLLDYGKERKSYVLQVKGRSVLVILQNIRFSKKIWLWNNIALLLVLSLLLKVIPFKRLRDIALNGNDCLKSLSESDIVTSISGGDSFSDIYGLGRLLYVGLPQLLAILMRKKLVQLPQTLGPFKSLTSRTIARFILRRSHLVYSRDRKGLKSVLETLGLETNVEKFRFCPDVGFILEPIAPAELRILDNKGKANVPVGTIGLNVSGLLYEGGYTQDNMFGLKIDYKELIYEIIDFLIAKENAKVMLVPHVFGTREQHECDSVACENIFLSVKDRYPGRLLVVSGSYNQNEIKYIIGLTEFFVGSRMHACIAAVSQGIPAVSISYSDKFIGVMETVGCESIVADPRILDKRSVIGLIEEAYNNRALHREKLMKALPVVKMDVLNLFKNI